MHKLFNFYQEALKFASFALSLIFIKVAIFTFGHKFCCCSHSYLGVSMHHQQINYHIDTRFRLFSLSDLISRVVSKNIPDRLTTWRPVGEMFIKSLSRKFTNLIKRQMHANFRWSDGSTFEFFVADINIYFSITTIDSIFRKIKLGHKEALNRCYNMLWDYKQSVCININMI